MLQTNFIRMVRADLNDHGFTLVLGRGRSINCSGYRVGGYFSETMKEIRVATRSPSWLGTLVHEYCHFKQYTESEFRPAGDAADLVDSWFSGVEYSQTRVRNAFWHIRACERDAERKAAKLIQEAQLPVNLDVYIRRANCYIYAHYIMERHRKFWAFQRDPFKSRTILAMMPNNFRSQAHESIPPAIDFALEALVNCPS